MANMRRPDLIQVLSDYLHHRASQVQVTPALTDFAKKHQVSGILYHQTRDPSLMQPYLQEIYLSKNREQLLLEIEDLFDRNQIDWFLLKGTSVAAFYPNPELRTMGDSDIVVSDRPGAARLLQEAGYEVNTEGLSEWPFFKRKFRFELHDRLVYSGENALLAFFNDSWDQVRDHQLDWNLHFVYLLEHLRHHLTEEGAGFRMFLDIAVLTQNTPAGLDWNQVRENLKRVNLLGFAETVFALNRCWFDMQPPFAVPEPAEDFLEYATDVTMKNGVFGYDNPDRDRSNVRMDHSENRSYTGTVVSRFIHKCFPGYHELIVWPEYQFLVGRRYLLPLCWIYRLFRNALHRSSWKSLKDYSAVSREQFDSKNEELRKWGL